MSPTSILDARPVRPSGGPVSRSGDRRLRVLFTYRSDVDRDGGAGLVMRHTADALRATGLDVHVSHELQPDASGFDLIHAFNVWKPETALEQLRFLEAADVPIVWSPIYLDLGETLWAGMAVRFIQGQAPEERARLLDDFRNGVLEVEGVTRWGHHEPCLGFTVMADEMMRRVDHLCLTSRNEARRLGLLLGPSMKPATITPHGVNVDLFRGATAEPFIERFGVRDFVLCVGALEGRKNQLGLIRALKGHDLPLVLVGDEAEADYVEICREAAGDDVLFTGRLAPELVASAYRAARVHALPSFSEGAALAHLEAAIAGRALVMSNRSSEQEYFGAAPFFCDPLDPIGIHKAVDRAWRSAVAEPERWTRLARGTAETYTWENTASATVAAYREVLARAPAHAGTSASAAGGPVRAPRAAESATASADPAGTRLRWTATALDYSGYSQASRTLLEAARRAGTRVELQSFSVNKNFIAELSRDPAATALWNEIVQTRLDDAVHVCFHPPLSWDGHDFFSVARRQNRDCHANVGYTMFETDRIPTGWAAACSAMDAVWVPGSFNLETFARSGVPREKLRVLELGVDWRRFSERPRPHPLPGAEGFVFLSVFQWSLRKGWDVLLDAYLRAFTRRDDVTLVIRAYPSHGDPVPVERQLDDYLAERGLRREEAPRIELLGDFLSEAEMPGLYAAADAFVLPTRGEGWGLPFMEAMAAGLPTIATRWSGHLDFMDDDNGYLIKVDGLVPVHPSQTEVSGYYEPDHLWAEPSVDHTATLMRRVFDDRAAARAVGTRAREHVRARHTIDRSVTQLAALTREVAESARRTRPREARGLDRMPLVAWAGPIYNRTGYSDEARQFTLGLWDQGAPVRTVPMSWGDSRAPVTAEEFEAFKAMETFQGMRPWVGVQHTFPTSFEPRNRAFANVGRTMFETDRVPAAWVDKCNAMDEVWVPGAFNRETFARSGVEATKLFTVPSPLDAELQRAEALPLRLDRPCAFNFLSVFDFTLRKGWDVLLRAWTRAFSAQDDVALYLKVSSSLGLSQRELVARIGGFIRDELGRDFRDIAGVEILVVDIDPIRMPSLYRAVDAYVMPSRGEGWGRPYMEAMAAGLPTIGTGWSGNTEFMDDENSYLIDHELVDVVPEAVAEAPHFAGHRWAEPSVDHLVELLRRVHRDRDDGRRRGARAREEVLSRYDRRVVATRVAERLIALRDRRA